MNETRSCSIVKCPAAMCPLMAKDGSPWTGDKDSDCPEDQDQCGWWRICSTDGMRESVQAAASGRPLPVIGPNRPRSYAPDPKKIGSWFDCPKAGQCSWQKAALKHGQLLCPPRDALKRGFDPRICLF